MTLQVLLVIAQLCNVGDLPIRRNTCQIAMVKCVEATRSRYITTGLLGTEQQHYKVLRDCILGGRTK